MDATYARTKPLGHFIVFEPTDEPWGVRGFYVTDPAGTLINVHAHPE